MSCWVVPAIAAEMWGVTVERVLAGIRDGTVATRTDHGFVFVDVAPGSAVFIKPRKPGEPPPPTFVLVPVEENEPVVTQEEAAILTGRVNVRAAHVRMLDLATALRDDREELPPLDVEEDAAPLPPREAMRAAVGRLRKPPPKAAA